MSNQESVAIIGAGLSGLSLALALHRQGIPSTIFETRDASLDIGGALMLSPNALRILDNLGVYSKLKPKGFEFEQSYFLTSDLKSTESFEFGSRSKYGYAALRVYRHELITILLEMVRDAEIKVEYGTGFSKIVEETGNGVTWESADGTRRSAPLLIGADGIHSRVRSYLYPELKPMFTKMIGVSAAVPTKQMEAPADFPLPAAIMNPKVGAFIIAPQKPDGSEVFIGKQRRFEAEPDKERWRELLNDKQWCVRFLQENNDEYPELVTKATSKISASQVNIWPFYVVPKLDTWVSPSEGRVAILGDAAHAIPPSAGQGVNQAFEDIYTFAKIVKISKEGTQRRDALRRWQSGRQGRIDQILKLNALVDKKRLPSSGEETTHEDADVSWLYTADFDSMVDDWLS